MLELAGQPALSDFRLAKLLDALQQADGRVKSVNARYCYFVAVNGVLSAEHTKRLKALLLAGDKAGRLGKGSRKIYVLPRPGTISPWSSKATDIALACGLNTVDRVERGICYGLKFKGQVDDEVVRSLDAMLHDRMTEAVFNTGEDAAALFEEHEPAPVNTISILAGGRQELAKANNEVFVRICRSRATGFRRAHNRRRGSVRGKDQVRI